MARIPSTSNNRSWNILKRSFLHGHPHIFFENTISLATIQQPQFKVSVVWLTTRQKHREGIVLTPINAEDTSRKRYDRSSSSQESLCERSKMKNNSLKRCGCAERDTCASAIDLSPRLYCDYMRYLSASTELQWRCQRRPRQIKVSFRRCKRLYWVYLRVLLYLRKQQNCLQNTIPV